MHSYNKSIIPYAKYQINKALSPLESHSLCEIWDQQTLSPLERSFLMRNIRDALRTSLCDIAFFNKALSPLERSFLINIREFFNKAYRL